MKRSGIGLGVFLVTMGVLVLLINLGVIDWTIIYSLCRLWPLLLVVIGINIVFHRNILVKTITWVTLLAVLITYSYVFKDSDFGKPIESRNVTIEKLAETKTGNLYLGLGGLELNIDSNTFNLLDGIIAARNITEDYSYSDNNDSVDINIKRDERSFEFAGFSGKQKCSFSLNKDILWNVKVDIGAASGTLDMAELQVGNLDINAGAVKFDLKLGNKSALTYVKVNSGASQYNISVPKDSGVRLKLDGALNSKNFKGIDLIKDGNYYTSANYSSAASKIDINVVMGVGSINIIGY